MIRIPCSYGELVDKCTILNIKLNKATSIDARNNIKNELSLLNPYIKTWDDKLIDKLQQINLTLWNLEDTIRQKSTRKEYDHIFVKCAEMIHTWNDKRYQTKRKLNIKYQSDIFEEKIYKKAEPVQQPQQPQHVMLSEAMRLFDTDPSGSLKILEPLYHNCKHLTDMPFCIDLYMSYSANLRMITGQNSEDRLSFVIDNLYHLDNERKKFYQTQIGLEYLHRQDYINAQAFVHYIQHATGPNDIGPDTISCFSGTDHGQTMLLYTSGGIGDIIMHGRFLREFCNKYQSNNIVLLSDNKVLWMLDIINDIDNLKIQSFNAPLPKYQHHNNLANLFCLLGHSYETIPWYPYLKELGTASKHKSYIIINWKGSEHNNHEIRNRRVPLVELLEAIDSSDLDMTLLTVQQDITEEERVLLDKHGVTVWNDDPTLPFNHTVNLLHRAKFVISSDTSLLHLAGSMDIPTIALLVRGCDWRWTQNERTNWYPNMTLLRQSTYGDWSTPMQRLAQVLRDGLAT